MKIPFFQSDDCTVFFFTVGDTYKPIGFIETASPVVSMEWSKKTKVKTWSDVENTYMVLYCSPVKLNYIVF